MADASQESDSSSSDDGTKRALEHIERALRGLRFGEVTVIVQDGVVVQVERTERTRLQRGKAK
jgi:hypothetical protein